MKYLSLCDGIGAAHEASKELEWTCVGASEIAAFPSAVVRERYPEIRELGDMTKHENWNIEPPDLICGGTPCQSFSVAGLRGGLADPRGNLALVFLGIVDRHRPKWVVWENVPGVYSATSHNAPDPDPPGLPLDVVRDHDVVEADTYDADEDHAFACFLAGLQELGYGVQYRTFDAQYFGVAQRRNRVFVVGYLGDWRPATAVLLEPEGMSGNPPPSRDKGERPAPTITSRARGGGGLGTDTDLDGGVIPVVANPLTARMHKGVNTTMDEGQTMVPVALGVPEVAGTMKAMADSGGFHNSPDHAAGGYMVPVAWKMRGGGNGTGERGGAVGTQGGVGYLGQEECAFTLSTTEDQHVAVPFAFKPSHFTRDKDGAPADIAPPLSSEADKGDQDAVVCVPQALDILGTPASLGAKEADVHVPLRARQPGQSEASTTTVMQVGMAVRRLTPMECERLQGFPDKYTEIPWRGKPAELCPDGPRYKALGNSWAVPNMRWIFRRIQKVDDIKKRLARKCDDRLCPCQDGDPCHYEDHEGTKAMPR